MLSSATTRIGFQDAVAGFADRLAASLPNGPLAGQAARRVRRRLVRASLRCRAAIQARERLLTRFLAAACLAAGVAGAHKAGALVESAAPRLAAAPVAAAVRPAAPRLATAPTAKPAADEGLRCAQPRQKLWSETRGWVVKRVSVCR